MPKIETKAKPPATNKQTMKWVRNESDQKAVLAGMVFWEKRGQYVVDWCKKYLRLYEGEEYAGQPLIMTDWQYEATMRAFGWMRWSEKYRKWIRRFRTVAVWVPKKNKKSPTLAAWGLYLLCGDGEKGQKVYFGAKNGQQAREIAGKHAMEMMMSSPDLVSECKPNNAELSILHEPTRSLLKPMSSGDNRTQKSKEGLNGSMLIDEVHVVDRDFMARISRAGISRREPLQIEASTAGDDPTSYGKSRWDYGEAVNRGEIADLYHLHVSYNAPQNLSDADLAANPIKYGKMANPAWGQTIDSEEFLADYLRSVQSGSELAIFKMYRLNIWQSSSTPWINMDKWAACAHDDSLFEKLKGRECYGGLDLSKTTDSTAFSLCFPPDDFEGDYIILTWFWIPEVTARAFNSLVPWVEWGKGGFVNLTEGDAVHYGAVLEKLKSIVEDYDCRVIRFDPRDATHLIQQLQDETGVECEQFVQYMGNFAGPTKDFERLTIDERIAHPNNPVMNWQVSVTTVKSDSEGRIRPTKPDSKRYQKVDGPISAVMALAGGLLSDGGGSFYDDNELESG